MLLCTLLESELQVLAQQCAINIVHVVTRRVGCTIPALHLPKITQRCGSSHAYRRRFSFRPLRPYALRKTIWLRMTRISGLEKNQAPWHLRWFYGVMRKMFGKDLTPAKIQMRLPGLVWGGVAMEAALGRKRLVSLRYIQLGKVRAAARVGCPF